MRISFFSCFAIVMNFLSLEVLANPGSKEVFFAGFSYLGESEQITENFPFTQRINVSENGVYYLDRVAGEIVRRSNASNLNINSSGLADINNENHLTLTLSISSETTSVEKIDNKYKLWVQVFTQLFLFDYSNMKIVGNSPIFVDYVAVFDSMPTGQDIENIFRQVIFHPDNGEIFKQLKIKVSELDYNEKLGNSIQVLNIEIEDSPLGMIPESYTANAVKNRLGELFTHFLSSNQGVNVLPYIKGHAVGNKLAGRYSDGKVFMLELPEPDFAFDIRVTHWLKQLYSESNAGSAWIYVARANFKFYEPLSQKVFFEEFLLNGATKIVPASQSIIDEWPSYVESTNVLFDKFTKQISNPSRDWLKTHARSTANFKQFNEMKKVIETCR